MSVINHIEQFKTALHGGKGELDAWLEVNNESECRVAILGLISQVEMKERARCKKAIEDVGPKEGPLALVTKGFMEALDI